MLGDPNFSSKNHPICRLCLPKEQVIILWWFGRRVVWPTGTQPMSKSCPSTTSSTVVCLCVCVCVCVSVCMFGPSFWSNLLVDFSQTWPDHTFRLNLKHGLKNPGNGRHGGRKKGQNGISAIRTIEATHLKLVCIHNLIQGVTWAGSHQVTPLSLIM